MAQLPETLGKYQIRSVLGKGAMGIVYEGFDPDIERQVAIKVLHEHLLDSAEGQSFKERFRREAQSAARCIHPNIVTIFELGNDNGSDFIAMEFIQGEELKTFLSSGQSFSFSEINLIISSVLKALSAAHKLHVVHRDIKPANIILLDDGNVKVADFGVAKLDNSDLTMAGNMVGTPSYMSPEGLRGESVDFSADLYSTAMVLFELLTGAKPDLQQLYAEPVSVFIDSVLSQHHEPLIHAELEQVIRKGLAEERSQRYASADEFILALQQALDNANDEAHDAVQNLARTVVNQKPLANADAQANIDWDDGTLTQLEQGLASYIGPLAKVLVKRSTATNTSHEALIDDLASHIDNETERETFIKKAKKQIGLTVTADVTASQSAVLQPLSQTLTTVQIQDLIQKMAFYIGPLATALVKRETAKHTLLSSCCESLASHIPNETEKKDFLKSIAHL